MSSAIDFHHRIAATIALLLIACSTPIHAEEILSISEPMELDKPAALTGGNFTAPNIAAGKDGFLVTWQGPRGGTRVDPDDFSILDPDGLSSTYFGDSFNYMPKTVVSNGANFLLYRPADSYADTDHKSGGYLYLADGETAVPINEPQWLPNNVFAMGAMPEGNYLLSWIEYSENGGTLKAVRVDGTTGMILDDPAGILLATGEINERIAVVGDPSGFVVVYDSYAGGIETLRAVRVLEDGSVLVPNGTVIAEDVGFIFDLQAVYGGLGTVALWSSATETYGHNLYGAILDENKGPSVSLLYSLDTDQYIFDIAAAAGTADIALLWQETPSSSGADTLRSALITTDGAELVMSQEIFTSAETESQDSPAVAFSNDTYLAVWQDHRMSGWQIFGDHISSDGQLNSDGFALAGAPNSQHGAHVASCGEHFLATWADDRFEPTNGYDVLAARITHEGEVIDTEAAAVAGSVMSDWPLGAAPSPSGCAVLSLRTPDTEGGSLVVREVNMFTGEPKGEEIELFSWTELDSAEATLEGTTAGLFAAFEIGTNLYVADVTDLSNPSGMEAPLYSTTESDETGSYWLEGIKSAVLEDTILLNWEESYCPGPDVVLKTHYIQRLRLAEGVVERVGDTTILESGVSAVSVLGDRFVLLSIQGDTMDALLVPKDPDDATEQRSSLFVSPNTINSVAVTSMEDGLLIVYRSYIPSADGKTSRAGLYAVLLDDALSVRVAPTFLPGDTLNHSVVSYADHAILFNETTIHDAERLTLQTIDITETAYTPDTESLDTDGSDTDSADTDNASSAHGAASSGCAFSSRSNPSEVFSFLFTMAGLTIW